MQKEYASRQADKVCPKLFVCPNFLYEKKMFKSVVDEEGDDSLVGVHRELYDLIWILHKKRNLTFFNLRWLPLTKESPMFVV